MKIAAFRYQDRKCLGVVSPDGATVRPFLWHRDHREDGLLGLICWLGSGGELPPPPRYLKAGDVVSIEVDGIGTIENRFN